MTAFVAAALLGAAVALALPGGSSRRLSGFSRSLARRSRPRGQVIAVAVASVAIGARLVRGEAVVLLLIGVAVSVGTLALWRRRASRLAAARCSLRVVEACEQLASELAAGLPPGPALTRAAAEWPPMAPVAEAFRVGADVPSAFRDLAATPGASDLRVVAAAWQVAHRAGHGLADALDRVAIDLRASAATRRLIAGELASARSTARLVAALPVAALLMGSGVGGDPWAFLLGTPVGLGALAVGLALGWVGLWWIEAIARSAESVR